jgi:hypothetical protein
MIIMKKFCLFLKFSCLFIAILLVIPGCAPRMSLEEAKKISMEMSGASFTPPPRRIDDIISVLQTHGQFDKRIADRFQQESKKQPPKTDDDAILARFYYERGLAFDQMGFSYDAMSDLRKAVFHAEKIWNVEQFVNIRIFVCGRYFVSHKSKGSSCRTKPGTIKATVIRFTSANNMVAKRPRRESWSPGFSSRRKKTEPYPAPRPCENPC